MTMTCSDHRKKRMFDLAVASFALLILWPIIVVAWILAWRDTGVSGFFRQERIGQYGKSFFVIKLRTMRDVGGTTVTTQSDARITPLGAYLRRWKLDELPQLINVVRGEMSIVGPRPDVPGFLDNLTDSDRRLLELKPGITGPATLKYRNEEALLDDKSDPERYNREVIWPDKIRINLAYMDRWSLRQDLSYIFRTLIS